MSIILKLGSKNSDVTRMQTLLNKTINSNLNPDGDFGPKTEAAVRKFQAIAGIGIDGEVGPKTWAALENAVSGKKSPKNLSVIDTTGASWMKVAKQEIGQIELKGSKHNPKIIQYHATTTLKATTDETAWCSSFVNWVLKQTGIKGTNSAAAASWLNWGITVAAKPGAITVLYNPKAANSKLSRSGNHVGFLVKQTASHYVLLGGNQSDSVMISPFPQKAWNLKGYRWPVKQ